MVERWWTIAEAMAATKPGIWGQPVLYVVLGMAYVIMALALLILLVKNTRFLVRIRWFGMLLVLLAALRGFIYVGMDYPWQTPDEQGHFEYVALLARLNRVPRLSDISPQLEQDVLRSMYDYRWWELGYRAPMPPSPPKAFVDDPILKLSWTQIEDEPFLYYALLAPIYKLLQAHSLLFILYGLRSVSCLLLAGSVLVAFLSLREVFPDNHFVVVGGTAFIALNPMAAYISSGIINDILGMLTATLLFAAVAHVCKTGLNWRRAVALLALTVLAVLADKPSMYLLAWTPLVLVILQYRAGLAWLKKQWRILAVAAGTAVLLPTILMFRPSQDAAGWVQYPWPGPVTRAQPDGTPGSYSLYIRDDSAGLARPLVQEVFTSMSGRQGTTLRFAVSARGSTPGQPIRLQLYDGVNTSVLTTTVGSAWQPVELTHMVGPGAWRLKATIAADSGRASDTGELYVRNVTLGRAGSSENLIVNGSGERAGNQLERLVAGILMTRGITIELFRFIGNPQLVSSESLDWYGRGMQTLFEWFWGRFAYLAVPLAARWYRLLLFFTLGGWSGLLVLTLRDLLSPARTAQTHGNNALTTLDQGTPGNGLPWRRQAMLLWALAVGMNFAEVTFPLLRDLRNWMPQGRYMFSVMLPLSVSLVAGWQAWMPRRFQKWGLLGLIGAFIAFDVLVIAFYIIPYYYGRLV
jgi:hypothetical protein